MLEQFAAAQETEGHPEDGSNLPKWLYMYLVYRFNLLDRTGNVWERLDGASKRGGGTFC